MWELRRMITKTENNETQISTPALSHTFKISAGSKPLPGL
jgi:hypothetical protein